MITLLIVALVVASAFMGGTIRGWWDERQAKDDIELCHCITAGTPCDCWEG